MFFSIIIPTYNKSNTLSYSIESILNQTIEQWELIIVDDGSTDNTKDVIEYYLKFNNISYIRQENKGVCSARNNGAKISKGEFLLFLDSDDVVSTTWLQDFNEEIIKSNADLVRCKSIINSKYEKDNQILLSGNFAIRKKIFFEVGMYDENIKFGENTELQWRLNHSGIKIIKISNFNFIYNIDSFAESENKKTNQVDFIYYVLEKHKNNFQNKKKLKQLLCQVAGVNCFQLGRRKEGIKLVWKGYFYKPQNVKSFYRAFGYTLRWIMPSTK